MLKFFGKGSAFSSEVNSSAYIHDKSSETLLVIDCGENTFGTISRYIRENLITKVNVLITHTHADHVAGLSTLIYYMKYVIGSTLHIYAPSSAIEDDINTMLKIFGHGRWDGYDIKNFESISGMSMGGAKTTECGKIYNIGNVTVNCVKTKHTDELKSYGYAIMYDSIRMYYSGDSCSLPTYVKDNIGSFDVIYQDLTHLHYDGNVHMSFEVFKEEYPKQYWNRVIPYHIGNRIEAISRCEDLKLDILIDKI